MSAEETIAQNALEAEIARDQAALAALRGPAGGIDVTLSTTPAPETEPADGSVNWNGVIKPNLEAPSSLNTEPVNEPEAPAPEPATPDEVPASEGAADEIAPEGPGPDESEPETAVSPSGRVYGHIPDEPDARDYLLAAPTNGILPPVVSLRKTFGAVYDQGNLGSCTAQAVGGVFEQWRLERKMEPVFVPARLFIYYNERSIEGTIHQDAGAQIRDGFKTAKNEGVCGQSTWPEVPGWWATKPIEAAYRSAQHHQVLAYHAVPQTLAAMKTCLNNGYPIVIGIKVYGSFEGGFTNDQGVIPTPDPASEAFLGGHAIVVVGYDDLKQAFEIRNSWGDSWMEGGYSWLGYDYLTNPNLANSLWTLRGVSH